MGPTLEPAQYLQWPGFILVTVGALLFAIFLINNKKLIQKGLPPDVITTFYCLGSGILFLVASFLFNPPTIWSVFDSKIGIFWPLLATCVLNIFIQFGNMRAQKYAETTLVAAIGSFQPLICLLPSWLILNETPNKHGYFGLVLVAIAIYVISLSQKIKDPAKVPAWGKTVEGNLRFTAPLATLFTNKGVQLAFLATSCGAVSINFDKKAALLSSFMFAPAVILLFVGAVGLLRAKRTDWQKLEKKHVGWLMLSVVLYFTTNVLYWLAFKYGMAIYVGSMKRLHLLFVLLLSYFFLKEELLKDKKYWFGILIFIVALFLFTIP